MVKTNCRKCGKCNKKGKPSVTRGSSFCEKMQTQTKEKGILSKIAKRLLEKVEQKEVKGFLLSILKREKREK